MIKKVVFLLLVLAVFNFNCASAAARSVAISTYSSSVWLPAEVKQAACQVVDQYLMSEHNMAVFDGSKSPDKKAMSKRIGKDADYVVSIELTGFYDAPHSATHFNANIKPDDTVATILLDYMVYTVASDQWLTGRVNLQAVYPGTMVPAEAALPDAVRQLLPKLAAGLNKVIN